MDGHSHVFYFKNMFVWIRNKPLFRHNIICLFLEEPFESRQLHYAVSKEDIDKLEQIMASGQVFLFI